MDEFDISDILSEEDFPMFQDIKFAFGPELALDPIPDDANLNDSIWWF